MSSLRQTQPTAPVALGRAVQQMGESGRQMSDGVPGCVSRVWSAKGLLSQA